MKPGNYNFLNKPRDSNGSFARTDIPFNRSSIDPSGGLARDFLSNPRLKGNWNQHTKKEAKPASFDPLKAPETKSIQPREDTRTAISNEAAQATKESFAPYSGYTVCIQNVPSHCNLGLVKHALSTHGEIVGSFKKSGSNGTCTIYVEFKVNSEL